MALDSKQVTKPLSKLRKLLKKMPKQPPPEQVHDLRTNIRRVEASLRALQLDRTKNGKRTLKKLSPLRKRAGDVRDMDVLTGFASKLPADGYEQPLVVVLEHLGESRFQSAQKLHRTITAHRKVARRRLKRCKSFVDRTFKGGKESGREWPVDAAADALQISGEISAWPPLTKENLHPFRLKVKELRNVLKISGDEDELVDRLRDVKDAIGEWHDWLELAAIVKDTLGKKEGSGLGKRIDQIARQKQNKALNLANQLRAKYFNVPRARGHEAAATRLKEPVLNSAAQLAAAQRVGAE